MAYLGFDIYFVNFFKPVPKVKRKFPLECRKTCVTQCCSKSYYSGFTYIQFFTDFRSSKKCSFIDIFNYVPCYFL